MGSRFEFSGFQFDGQTGELRDRVGDVTLLRPKTAALLTHFLTHAHEPMSREHLLACIWDEEIVSGHNLTQSISELRKALGENGRGSRFIKTIPKKGYLWLQAPTSLEENRPRPDIASPGGDLPPQNHVSRSRPNRLHRLGIALGAVILILAGTYLFRSLSVPRHLETRPGPFRVAVLPIANETGDPTLNWVRYGLLEMAAQYLEMTGVVSPMQPPDIIRFWNAADAGSAMTVSKKELGELFSRFEMDAILCLGFYEHQGDRPYRLEARKLNSDGSEQTWSFPLRSPFDLLATLPLTLKRGLPDSNSWPMPEEIFPGDEYVNRTLLWGVHFSRLHDYKGAKPFFEATLHLVPEFLPARLRLATCLANLGEFSESEAMLDEMLLEEGLENQPYIHARALHDKGALELKKGNREEGVCLLLESLEIAETHLGAFAQSNILTTLGSNFFLPEHLEQAREWQLRGLALGDKWSLPCPTFANLINLGNGFSLLDDMDNAMVYWSMAFRQSVVMGTKSEIATLMNNMARVAFIEKDFLLAEQMCQDSYAIRTRYGDTINATHTLMNLASIYREDGRSELAEKTLKQAFANYKEINYPAGLMDCHYQFGLKARGQGNLTEAKVNFERSLELAESLNHKPMMKTLREVLAALPRQTVHGTALNGREFH